ncbi:MAG: ribokinase [Chloroflexota bacterium]|nr:ribokinase [Chloroflexota bacterium]
MIAGAYSTAMSARVVVVGSINVDLVVSVERLPLPGETVLGGSFARYFGGKGANQAVAAARAGADVTMVGAVGEDDYGTQAVDALRDEGIDVSGVRRVSGPTGVALVVVGPRGENQIAVAPGANRSVTPAQADLTGVGAPGAALLTTFEVPMATCVAAVRSARHLGMVAIVDPSPAHALSSRLLDLGPILTPNEHEVTVAIGNDDPVAALDELSDRHRGPIVVTQGAAGALLVDGERRQRFASAAAAVVDTTGAGDTFNGVLATFLAEGAALEDAIRAATTAAGISVGRPGARAGMPNRRELAAVDRRRSSAKA